MLGLHTPKLARALLGSLSFAVAFTFIAVPTAFAEVVYTADQIIAIFKKHDAFLKSKERDNLKKKYPEHEKLLIDVVNELQSKFRYDAVTMDLRDKNTGVKIDKVYFSAEIFNPDGTLRADAGDSRLTDVSVRLKRDMGDSIGDFGGHRIYKLGDRYYAIDSDGNVIEIDADYLSKYPGIEAWLNGKGFKISISRDRGPGSDRSVSVDSGRDGGRDSSIRIRRDGTGGGLTSKDSWLNDADNSYYYSLINGGRGGAGSIDLSLLRNGGGDRDSVLAHLKQVLSPEDYAALLAALKNGDRDLAISILNRGGKGSGGRTSVGIDRDGLSDADYDLLASLLGLGGRGRSGRGNVDIDLLLKNRRGGGGVGIDGLDGANVASIIAALKRAGLNKSDAELDKIARAYLEYVKNNKATPGLEFWKKFGLSDDDARTVLKLRPSNSRSSGSTTGGRTRGSRTGSVDTDGGSSSSSSTSVTRGSDGDGVTDTYRGRPAVKYWDTNKGRYVWVYIDPSGKKTENGEWELDADGNWVRVKGGQPSDGGRSSNNNSSDRGSRDSNSSRDSARRITVRILGMHEKIADFPYVSGLVIENEDGSNKRIVDLDHRVKTGDAMDAMKKLPNADLINGK